MQLRVNKVERITGQVQVPGDKSISHRALIFGALASEETHILNFLGAQDCISTLECLRSLGVPVRYDQAKSRVVVEGVGLYGLKEPRRVLDAGNSGTTIRILPGVLAGQDFFSVITGDESLNQRPMRRIVEPLVSMGAEIRGRADGRYAPLAISGRPLSGIAYTTQIPSAQVKTSVIAAGLLAEGETLVSETGKSRDHTERMLQFLGAEVEVDGLAFRVVGKTPFSGGQIEVPGDLSSAAFFLTAAALVPRSRLLINQVGVNPTRAGILDVLKRMGAPIAIEKESKQSGEPRADLIVEAAELRGAAIDADLVPRIIDELPLVAVAGTQAVGRTVITGAKELRVKESDRLAAMARELTKMGAKVVENEDGLEIKGPTKLKGAHCRSYGDHRVAMALAIAGLLAEGTTVIEDSECIGISYPEFAAVLKSVTKS